MNNDLLGTDELKLLEKIANRNSKYYNINKLKEECLELALIITQIQNKPQKIRKEKPDELYKELADVILRISIMIKAINKEEYDKVNNSLKQKIEKYKGYLANNTYKEI